MLIPNQQIDIVWDSNNREWYENKGYVFTKYKDHFICNAEDLNQHAHRKVLIKCDYCGTIKETHQSTHYNAMHNYPFKDCCDKCAGKKTSEVSYYKRREKSWSLLEKHCKEKHYTLITNKNEFTDVKMQIRYICPIHGEMSSSMDNMIRKGCGCSKCRDAFIGLTNILDVDYVEEYINNINNNVWINKSEYKNSTTHNIDILCGKCKNKIFTTSFNNYKRAGVNQCFSCSNKASRGEELIASILNKYNIDFIPEYRFDDCRDKRSLPFDFYIPLYNLIIEFDGQHHYENHENWSNFEITKKHDEIKNDYCYKKNINLLRIPYWDGNNLEEIILNKINELKNVA